MYNKLFTKILDSSIWLESTTTRLVWLTFLAAMDEHGFAQFASASNVAHRARVELSEAEEALKTLEAPDEDSADPENEGRRLEKVPGGWMVLNSKKYRDLVTKAVIQEQTRLRVKRYRDHKNGIVEPDNSQCNAPVTHSNESVTPSRAVSKAKEKKEYTEEALNLTKELISLMRRNDPKARIPDSLDSWHSSAELLLGKDGRELGECVSVLRGALNDNFWRSNILSMPKFREKFTGLRAKFLPPAMSNPITKATGAFAD